MSREKVFLHQLNISPYTLPLILILFPAISICFGLLDTSNNLHLFDRSIFNLLSWSLCQVLLIFGAVQLFRINDYFQLSVARNFLPTLFFLLFSIQNSHFILGLNTSILLLILHTSILQFSFNEMGNKESSALSPFLIGTFIGLGYLTDRCFLLLTPIYLLILIPQRLNTCKSVIGFIFGLFISLWLAIAFSPLLDWDYHNVRLPIFQIRSINDILHSPYQIILWSSQLIIIPLFLITQKLLNPDQKRQIRRINNYIFTLFVWLIVIFYLFPESFNLLYPIQFSMASLLLGTIFCYKHSRWWSALFYFYIFGLITLALWNFLQI